MGWGTGSGINHSEGLRLSTGYGINHSRGGVLVRAEGG